MTCSGPQIETRLDGVIFGLANNYQLNAERQVTQRGDSRSSHKHRLLPGCFCVSYYTSYSQPQRADDVFITSRFKETAQVMSMWQRIRCCCYTTTPDESSVATIVCAVLKPSVII